MRSVSCAVLALGLAACSSAPPGATSRRLSIATGGTGGVYYVYGGALAQVLSRNLPGVEATAEVTAASVENLDFLAQGSADLAFSLADTASDAVAGRNRFKAPLPVCALASLYDNVTHVVVRADAPIRSVAELKGRRVSLGSPNSGTEVIADRVLRAAGLDPARDVTPERLGGSESAEALKDGRIDAFFFSAGLPNAAVMELAATPGVPVRMLSDGDLAPRLSAAHGPLYGVLDVPADTYKGVPAARVTIVRNLLMARCDLTEDLAYRITRLLFEKKADLAAVHPAARDLDPARSSVAPVPVHPGAIRYYREAGAWKEPR
jgi:TRAP transporter TAXI family solute receptor